MEIKLTTNQILKVLHILSWIIFIGLCVEAGGLLVNTVITSFITQQGVRNFWDGADYLSGVYKFDQGYFFVITIVMIIVAVLKAAMFYLIVRLFIDKKLSIAQPFNTELKHFILIQGFLALGIGFFAHLGSKYTIWLTQQGVLPADLKTLNIDGANVWFFMAIVLFIILQVVNKGVEIRQENDLTI